jgi:excisionase family DNA binding protein
MAMQIIQDDVLLTFKEAQGYLRVSRSTLYRLMWSGQLTSHKVGSTWRFYREDLRACVTGPQEFGPSSQTELEQEEGDRR